MDDSWSRLAFTLSSVLTLLFTVVAFYFGSVRAQARSSEKTAQDVSMVEEKLLQSVAQAVAASPNSLPPTYSDLTQGSVPDRELLESLAELAARMQRLETVSEKLEVRRQALLETYHNQGLSQSRVSFAFSLALGALGFAVIVFAVLTKNQQAGAYIAGAVTEAVAALFFTQSNQARRLMADFFDKLRVDRRLEECLKLTHNIEDEKLRSSMKALVALQLVDSKVSPSVLPGFGPDAESSPN